MKKWISLILVFTLCCGIFTGCGEEKQEAPGVLSAGFSNADITPEGSLPLDGYSGDNDAQHRWSEYVEKPLYATCTAITDAKGCSVMIITLDLLHASQADIMRSAIAEATGIPFENIIFHCTHDHSSIAVRLSDPQVMDYVGKLTDTVVSIAKQAMEDRKPIQNLETGFGRTDGANSVRHYLLTNGEYAAYTALQMPAGATWYGYFGESDNLLQALKITREGGKPIILVNWQAHPCANVSKKAITSDFPGAMRESLEAAQDCHAVFIQGAAGNLMTATMLQSEMAKHDRTYIELGQLLAETAVDALENGQTVEKTDLFLLQKVLEKESKYGDKRKIYINGFSIGDFAMITAPFETFDTNAMAVKESSPYQMTFYASCANGANGYLPTPESFEWTHAYEVSITSFPKGTAELIEQTQKDLLTELFSKTGRTQAQKPAGYVRDPFVPQSDGLTYYTLAPSLDVFTPVKNGFYSFETLDEKGNRITLLAKDLSVAEKILANPSSKLMFDQQRVVVGIAE